jgi:acetyl esterase/lipase
MEASLLKRWRWIALAALLVATAGTVSSCGGVLFAAANAPALFGKYTREANIPYGGGPRRTLDAYLPDQPAASRPLIVFWYGGSWMKGGKEQYRFVGAALALRGYVAVLPDYRVYPEVKFPDFMDDAALALKWAQDNAVRLGADPRRIYVMGHSAGAHIAALLALDARYLERVGGDPRQVRGLIGMSGPYALAPDTELLRTIFGAPFTEADWQPVQFVTAASPPTLLLHGSADRVVWIAHSEQLEATLRAAGVAVDLRRYEGAGHADPVAALSVPGRGRAPVLDDISAFVSRSDPSP